LYLIYNKQLHGLNHINCSRDICVSSVRSYLVYLEITLNTYYLFLENEEFAKPGAYRQQGCTGRLCAKCGRCRDWYYTGDASGWQLIQNFNNWEDEDWIRYQNDRVWERFKKRDGATCAARTYAAGLDGDRRRRDNAGAGAYVPDPDRVRARSISPSSAAAARLARVAAAAARPVCVAAVGNVHRVCFCEDNTENIC
jgi:hypothetical protein